MAHIFKIIKYCTRLPAHHVTNNRYQKTVNIDWMFSILEIFTQGILDNRLLQENILGQRDSADKNIFKTPSPKIQNILSRFLYYLTSIQKATQQKYFSHKL